ncbi:FliO/MopB family protein [Sulfobacillus harzensis]|uniref:Flagellar biosynthesis protein FliO n=1 Tax=Sulfobacillus harzensis TaxID=2729629 RepID=A0A7Y0L4H7_9FIRM|nr:flagellar biosynthetic protein FliO [Sulfobacillus harzensis]NMP23065.1 flagellar biosynthesis protein FliO [Sulfobacillus harzensis]
MSSVGLFLRFLWAMALVVALAWGAARMLKKIGFGKISASRYLNQIDYLSLGPKRGVALVQLVDRTVALGVTDQSISLLMEIPPEAMAERATATVDGAPASPPSLSQFAEEMMKRLKRDGRE